MKPSSGVASAHIGPAFQVEFHADQYDTRQRFARVHHCLLRVRDRRDVQALTQSEVGTALRDSFAQFAHLESLVVETGHALVSDPDVESLLDLLSASSTSNVQHRTSDEAHALALEAKSTTLPSSAGLLSPFWCAPEYASKWKIWSVRTARIHPRLS